MVGQDISDSQQVFRRAGGKGWLALACHLPAFDEGSGMLTEKLLDHMDLSRPPRLVLGPDANREIVDSFLENIEVWLGGRLWPEDLAVAMAESWAESGLVVLAGGPWHHWVAALASQPRMDFLAEGTLLYAAGSAAEALGAWVFPAGEQEPAPGLGWLPDAALLTGVGDPASCPAVREFLSRMRRSYAVSLPAKSVLALGPAGEVEVWSQVPPTVALGVGWRQA
ncbi:MAG: hypothetical protein AB1449_11480 [Chloroflexota bacterium]